MGYRHVHRGCGRLVGGNFLEALSNIAKHSHATRASVRILDQGQRSVIEVHDDGIGGAVEGPGGGLQGLRERVVGAEGQLRIVLAWMAQGRSNSAIATSMVVSDGAVEKHISSIFNKLDLAPSDSEHRRVLAVLMYLRN